MTRILREADADPSSLRGEAVGIVGFGNQGAAQALCLREAGFDVHVFTRPHGPSRERALTEGFPPAGPADLARCGVIALLVPDEVQGDVLEALVHPQAKRGSLLLFAHGFALRELGLRPRTDLDVALLGPLGPGSLLRARFLEGRGLPGLLAVIRDATGRAEARALAYAAALRMTRAGLLPTTLEEEVVSDLFAEQAVLVGGVVQLMRSAWEVLVEGGVSEEIAYYACVQELKQMMDLVHEAGLAGMRERISRTAAYGGLTRGPRVIGPSARAEMRRILGEVKSGRFAAEWVEERGEGGSRLGELIARERTHPIEEAGRRVREGLGGPRGRADSGGEVGGGAPAAGPSGAPDAPPGGPGGQAEPGACGRGAAALRPEVDSPPGGT